MAGKVHFNPEYQPSKMEAYWYDQWIQAGCFKAVIDQQRKPYCVMMPPPNVTGVLTMGHVLNNTIQDVLVRHARQQGQAVLWLPGTDHAGLATQTKVEKQLAQEGKTKQDLGRDAFLERVKSWSQAHGGIIIDQLKRLGASCDWDRSIYTLDDDYAQAVLTAFVKLYEQGSIYKGQRMVNWCPASLTALSDEEVFVRTEQSFLYQVRYAVVEYPGEYLEICTQRPETILADVALAFHPHDERYQKYLGCHVIRPFVAEKIPVIADSAIDPDFGTGLLKVTPAHAKIDFEIAQRHGLTFIDILNADGTLNEQAGPQLMGLERFAARKKSVELLQAEGILRTTIPHTSNIGYSERGNVPVEPRLSQQWFLRYPCVEQARAVVQSNLIRFYPQRWVKTYLHWLDHIQDWCISRQIWWGHRIPVWYKKGLDRNNPQHWHVSVNGPADPQNWEQDPDTLDTWASSWLWPFATLGWPDTQAQNNKGLDYWFPTQVLVTGPDIIFFWVARMIMAALALVQDDAPDSLEDCSSCIPFKDVYFTGIIRDAQGRKMSKSLGNSPDPLKLIDQYGADGLRFGILSMAPQGQDILFNENKIQQGRHFCSKLWNAVRFRHMHANGLTLDNSSAQHIANRLSSSLLDADDQAILLGLKGLTQQIEAYLQDYEFNLATQALYGFFWADYCDWYLEAIKSRLSTPANKPHLIAMQDWVIRQLLLLMHPFIPFITEEIWQSTGYAGHHNDFIQNHTSLNPEQYVQILSDVGIQLDAASAAHVQDLREFVAQARALKAQAGLQAQKNIRFELALYPHKQSTVEHHIEKLKQLIGCEAIACLQEHTLNAISCVTVLGPLSLIQTGVMIDQTAQLAKLNKELERLSQAVQANRSKLEDPTFMARAPAHIIEGARQQLQQVLTQFEETKRLVEQLRTSDPEAK